MKSLFLLMTLILSLNGFAQSRSPTNYSCQELYKMRSVDKLSKRYKIQKSLLYGGIAVFAISGVGSTIAGGYAALAALSAVGSKVALGGLAMSATGSSWNQLDNGNTKEKKILALENDLSKERMKLMKYVQKRVPGVTEEQVEEEIKQGFLSGDFCPDHNLMRPNEIKKDIVAKLKKRLSDEAISKLKAGEEGERCTTI